MFLIDKDSFEIKKTKEKGFGVFATQKISKGTIIGDYLGKVIKTRDYDLENDKNGLYLMYYTDQASIYPDLNTSDIHLINHSCEPNSWIYTYKSHTLFFAFKDIKQEEEITISYLLSPKGKCDPCTHICKCENNFCTGTMHLSEENYEKWQKFQKGQSEKTKPGRFVYGKNLPKLRSYPKILSTDPIYEAIF